MNNMVPLMPCSMNYTIIMHEGLKQVDWMLVVCLGVLVVLVGYVIGRLVKW